MNIAAGGGGGSPLAAILHSIFARSPQPNTGLGNYDTTAGPIPIQPPPRYPQPGPPPPNYGLGNYDTTGGAIPILRSVLAGALQQAPMQGQVHQADPAIAQAYQAALAGPPLMPNESIPPQGGGYPAYPQGTPTPGSGIGGPAAPDNGAPQGIVFGYANGQAYPDTPQGRIAYALARASSDPNHPIVRELAKRLGRQRRGTSRNQRLGF